jgi:hypothetical protein
MVLRIGEVPQQVAIRIKRPRGAAEQMEISHRQRADCLGLKVALSGFQNHPGAPPFLTIGEPAPVPARAQDRTYTLIRNNSGKDQTFTIPARTTPTGRILIREDTGTSVGSLLAAPGDAVVLKRRTTYLAMFIPAHLALYLCVGIGPDPDQTRLTIQGGAFTTGVEHTVAVQATDRLRGSRVVLDPSAFHNPSAGRFLEIEDLPGGPGRP